MAIESYIGNILWISLLGILAQLFISKQIMTTEQQKHQHHLWACSRFFAARKNMDEGVIFLNHLINKKFNVQKSAILNKEIMALHQKAREDLDQTYSHYCIQPNEASINSSEIEYEPHSKRQSPETAIPNWIAVFKKNDNHIL